MPAINDNALYRLTAARIRRALSPAISDGPNATSAEPSTTSNAPPYARPLICSACTYSGHNQAAIATAANVTNGVIASVALTREASQWASASANAP